MIDFDILRFDKMKFLDKQSKIETYLPLFIISKASKERRWVLISIKSLNFYK